MDTAEQVRLIKRGVVTLIDDRELAAKIDRKKILHVKLGVDPTAPDIHLGHTVVLRKLRQFQDLGHRVTLIIGDFTALIGDPSGRTATRPALSPDEIERNARTYLDQIGKVIDVGKASIRRNSEWLGVLTFAEIMRLADKLTVARMLERDDFSKRFKSNIDIGLHEFLYPMMQAYDSVAIEADVELGGNDQLFNLLVGRRLQRALGQEEQVVLTVPLLVGTNGVEKMSKSYGNHIGVGEPASEMYGKAMSIPDSVMKDYFTLLTDVPTGEADETIAANPLAAKKRLAFEIVKGYHREAGAKEAAERWEAVMSRKEVPKDIPALELSNGDLKEGKIWIVHLVAKTKAVGSNNDARRLVAQGGVEINGEKIVDVNTMVGVRSDDVLKVGKKNRYFKLAVRG